MNQWYQRLRIWGWVLCIGLAVAAPVAAQEKPDMSTVHDAFIKGDAHLLLDKAGERIEIALMGEGKLYSRAQATYVMQDFFQSYLPEQFTLEPGYGAEGSWIASGEYRYREAESSLQVYIRLRLKDKTWEVREIHIEQRR